jgi:hypothetical protein
MIGPCKHCINFFRTLFTPLGQSWQGAVWGFGNSGEVAWATSPFPHVVSPRIQITTNWLWPFSNIYSTHTDVKQGNRLTSVNSRDATEVGTPGGVHPLGVVLLQLLPR